MSAKKKAAKRARTSTKRASAVKPKARAAAPKKGGATKKVAAKKSPAKKAIAKKAIAKKAIAKKAIAKKAVAKKAAIAKPAKAIAKPAKPAAMKRRDGAGHLDPKYAADLRARARPKDNERAFGNDALSRELGGEFVETVTSGEDEGNEVRDTQVTEELGGPFTVTSGGTEFAEGVDGSNPKRATREPFPRT